MNKKALSRSAWILIAIVIVVLAILTIIFWNIINKDACEGEDCGNNVKPKSVDDSVGNDINCQEDSYNCGDFITQAEAQEVFDFCDEQGAGDIHRLDNDEDGVVCESLS